MKDGAYCLQIVAMLVANCFGGMQCPILWTLLRGTQERSPVCSLCHSCSSELLLLSEFNIVVTVVHVCLESESAGFGALRRECAQWSVCAHIQLQARDFF